MIKELQIRLLPPQAATKESIIDFLVKEKGFKTGEIKGINILRRSIDARQRLIYINLSIQVFVHEEPSEKKMEPIKYPDVSQAKQVVVVGAGPAGLFAALRLIELGLKPVVIERGRPVRERKKDIAQISRSQVVNADSNYCFGEGGAGAFSDGKLYTRSKKRGNVERILTILCQFGASQSILIDAHPHVGTDKLPAIIEAIRNQIIQSGGEMHFMTKMSDLIVESGQVTGIVTTSGKTFNGPVILATGHSARDVYRLLFQKKIKLEAKGFALGVRVEHPQTRIDQIQYHTKNERGPFLPPAEYSLVAQTEERGVYSFCMCPGGFIIPSASAPFQVVVNGMSPSNRNSRWANAGMVVEFRPEDATDELQQELSASIEASRGQLSGAPCSINESGDLPSGPAFAGIKQPEVLKLMHLQDQLEYLCYLKGGSSQQAPAQRITDFTTGRPSTTLPESSYTPGIVPSPLHDWLPTFIKTRLQQAFRYFDKQHPGFLTDEGILIGVETRTSSPVRICRNSETLEHTEISGLYPCGEGAGYAGGIVSAAIDGERCAESIANRK